MKVYKTKAEQVEIPRDWSLDEAIKEGGIVNERILEYWRPRWERNFCMLSHMIRPDTMNLSSLRGEHDGETCIIVSTGPSLDRNIAELKQVELNGASIMATTSSVIPLLVKDVKPTYAVINDGAPWVADLHFKELREDELGDVPLLVATSCHPSTPESWPGPLFFYHDYCPDDPLLGSDGLPFRVHDQLLGIPVGGCSTNLAVRVAVLMGYTKIIMIGMDLGFPGRKSHCMKYKRNGNGWEETPVTDEFFTKKARWIYRGCPKGCAFVIRAWEQGDPVKGTPEKCPQCSEAMRHVLTSSEYLFYMRDLIPLTLSKAVVDVAGDRQERDIEIINATGDGIGTLIKCAPLAEAIQMDSPEQAVEEST